jgi:hypothetical protein
MPRAAFYTLADAGYFLGAVGLVNSLRLVGHGEPILLLDCGLTHEQRTLLAPHAEVVPAPSDDPPWLLKATLPLARPAAVMLLLDSDMVAARSLAPLIERATASGVAVFRNPIQRHHPEWGEILGLGPIRRQPYVSSAAVCVATEPGLEVLTLLAERQRSVDFDRTYWRRNVPGYPFTYADQDVLNAILASHVEPERIATLEDRLASTPPFTGLRVADERTLECAYEDGLVPYLVHHHTTKPWLEPTHEGVYSRLLRRLLLADDVAVRVPEAEIPPWLRRGPRAWAERKLINLRERRKAASA